MTDAPEKSDVVEEEGESERLYGLDPALVPRVAEAIRGLFRVDVGGV